MQLTHTYNPVDAPSSQLLDLNDPDGGTLAMSIRPSSTTGNFVYRDLLAAMGQDRDYAAARTHSVTDNRRVAEAYLQAHDIRRIIVVHCEWARTRTADQGLAYLLDLARSLNMDLDLVSELDGKATASTFVKANDGLLLEWIPQRFERAVTTAQPVPASSFPLEVPFVDFPLFRDACRRLLTPHEFRTVDGVYTSSFHRARAALSGVVNSSYVITFLREQLATVDRPAHATTVIRASQAAAFTHGTLIKIDLGTLGYFIATANHRTLSTDELKLLRRIYAPWKAAAVVLTDAGLSIDQLLNLRLDDVESTGAVTHAGSRLPLADEGRLHIRALRHQRLAEELIRRTAATNQLFTSQAPAVRSALYNARRDLEIPLQIPRWRSLGTRNPFVTDLALSVHQLTGQAHP